MHKAKFLLVAALLLNITFTAAETRHYKTAPTHSDHGHQDLDIPLLKVDPDSRQTEVYIAPGTPQPSQYSASATYKLNADQHNTGLHSAVHQLQQKMLASCPDGWVKLEEWVTVADNDATLHYAFSCLHQ